MKTLPANSKRNAYNSAENFTIFRSKKAIPKIAIEIELFKIYLKKVFRIINPALKFGILSLK